MACYHREKKGEIGMTNEIERALATLQDLLDNSIFTSRIDFALEVAIEALQDRLKTRMEI